MSFSRLSITLQAPDLWLFGSCVGAYALMVLAGTPTRAGRFVTMALGRRTEKVLSALAEKWAELRFYYRTGEVGGPVCLLCLLCFCVSCLCLSA